MDDADFAARRGCWTGHTGCVASSLFASADREDTTAFVHDCYGLLEAARQPLVDDGCEWQRVRIERFGRTG